MIEKLTKAQIEQRKEGFLTLGDYASESPNGDLLVCCVEAAKKGRIEQMKELTRHFSKGLYADECRYSVNEYIELCSM